jgi:hypothetical protein
MSPSADSAAAPENESHFCMAITPDELPETAQRQLQGRRAALLDGYRWQPGNILNIRFLSGSGPLQARVKAAAAGWLGQKLADLRFSWRSHGPTDVRIDFSPGNGSWSHIGTYCQEIEEPKPTMNFGWLTEQSSDDEVRRVVLHEFGHALGLIHEHQNPESPIKWNVPHVVAALSAPPNSWDAATIQHNMFDLYDPKGVTATKVDPLSIMMYPIPKSWTLDGFSSGLNAKLSPTDRSLVRKVYQPA